jgi:hypothetical protein
MKKLFILFIAAGLLTACKNNPFARNDDNTKTRDKDDRNTRDDKEDKDDRKNTNDRNKDDDRYTKDGNDDYTSKEDSKGQWTTKDRNKWLDECTDEMSSNPQAKRICSCVLEKAEQKYTDVRDAERASEEDGKKLFRQCMTDINGGDENIDDKYKDRNNVDDLYKDNNRNTWTDQQRQQYIKECSATARPAHGFTEQQANSFCDCMTRKVEQKYSFQEATKLTTKDFQTQEWQNAANDCEPQY